MFFMIRYQILQAFTSARDREPSGVWHICASVADGWEPEWEDVIGVDFDSYESAKKYAAEIGISVDE